MDTRYDFPSFPDAKDLASSLMQHIPNHEVSAAILPVLADTLSKVDSFTRHRLSVDLAREYIGVWCLSMTDVEMTDV